MKTNKNTYNRAHTNLNAQKDMYWYHLQFHQYKSQLGSVPVRWTIVLKVVYTLLADEVISYGLSINRGWELDRGKGASEIYR